MWETIDLRELRVFLTLAEELHFGRTAQRLSLTPSRVSQMLRALEHKLGAPLVHRTSRRVELTAFGERFHREAAAAYEHLSGVLQRAHAANRSLEGTLRVFQFSGPASGPHLLSIIDVFEGRHPESHVHLGQLQQDDILGQLRRGEADLITTWLPIEQPDVVIGPILNQEPRVLAVARDHPLAERSRLSVEEIADHPFALFADLPSELQEAWVPPRTPSGRVIQRRSVQLQDRGLAELILRITRGEVVHLTIPSAAPYLGPDIVYVPIDGMPPWRSALAWRRGATDPRVREFVRIARELLRGVERSAGAQAARQPRPRPRDEPSPIA